MTTTTFTTTSGKQIISSRYLPSTRSLVTVSNSVQSSQLFVTTSNMIKLGNCDKYLLIYSLEI